MSLFDGKLLDDSDFEEEFDDDCDDCDFFGEYDEDDDDC